MKWCCWVKRWLLPGLGGGLRATYQSILWFSWIGFPLILLLGSWLGSLQIVILWPWGTVIIVSMSLLVLPSSQSCHCGGAGIARTSRTHHKYYSFTTVITLKVRWISGHSMRTTCNSLRKLFVMLTFHCFATAPWRVLKHSILPYRIVIVEVFLLSVDC